MFYILDDNKNPVRVSGVEEWAIWFERNLDQRHVAIDDYGDVRVSTVFLGVNHNHFGDGPPILFETLIFGGEHDGEMWRYATWREAEAGHEAACNLVKQQPNGANSTA